MHHRNEDRFRGDGFLDLVGINSPIEINTHIGDLCPKFLKEVARVEDGGMFNLSGDDMTPFIS
jgi:hypothetical protein